MTTDDGALVLSPDQCLHEQGIAHFLAGASLAQLAYVAGALAVELGTVRGLPVADLFGRIQSRLEYVAECAR